MLKTLNKYRHYVLFVALQLWCVTAFACANVLLVSSNSHFGMVHRIEAALYAQPTANIKLFHVVVENIKDSHFLDQYRQSCLIVTIGTEALAHTLKSKTKTPILSVLARKSTFNALLREHNRRLNDSSAPISVIYLDQPLERQLFLVQSLLSKETENNVGVLLGPNSLPEQGSLQSLAAKNKLKLNTIYVNKFENPVAVLDALLDETNIVLAIPDNRIFNTKTTRGMLLTAFHKRVPLIGYSRTYVNNGALAAVYSTTKQLADQSAKQVIHMLATNKMQAPQYPKEFAVAVNYQVARSLGLSIESEVNLKQTIDKMEKNAHG
ncbi:MAG: hypothetical protein JSR17_10180 [Proteobacteria bacterium]|nr:hypothetical protein [Pseudomonadota bacterium]